MMFWKRKNTVKENPLQDKVAGKIASGLLKVQSGFVDGMNKLFGGMTMKRMRVWLIIFCVVSGGLSIYFFVDAIVSKPKAKFKIDHVSMPQHFDRGGDEVMENEIPDDIYLQIQDYRKYMDSMGLAIRPSLEDSMRILEQIYLQQKK